MLNSLLSSVIADGRVLVIETENGRDRFLPPSTWGDGIKLEINLTKSFRFLPTSSLSETWLLTQLVDSKMKKQAEVRHSVQVLNKLFVWADSRSKRLTKDDATRILIYRFKYSELVAKEAWNDPAFSIWRKPGALRDEEKIESNIIKELSNGRGDCQNSTIGISGSFVLLSNAIC